MSKGKQTEPARIVIPAFKNYSERRKWIAQQPQELRKLLTTQAKRDAGRARGRQRKREGLQRMLEPEEPGKDQEREGNGGHLVVHRCCAT